MGSESFSHYMLIAPGCYGNLGVKNDEVGSGAEIHNPLFDIDEKAMITGACAHIAFAVEFLESDEKIEFVPQVTNLIEFYKNR